jgi:hypothetical protein
MFTNNKKWRSTSWLTMLNSLFSFPTFLLFSPIRLVLGQSRGYNENIWHLNAPLTYGIEGAELFEFYCMLLFDKSNKRSIKLEIADTWSKSNLNMMNIYEESTINFGIWDGRPFQLNHLVSLLVDSHAWNEIYK